MTDTRTGTAGNAANFAFPTEENSYSGMSMREWYVGLFVAAEIAHKGIVSLYDGDIEYCINAAEALLKELGDVEK